jgi:hypothetical protein
MLRPATAELTTGGKFTVLGISPLVAGLGSGKTLATPGITTPRRFEELLNCQRHRIAVGTS